MAILSLCLSYNNLGNYLSWFNRFASFNQLHQHNISAGKIKQIEKCKDDQITCQASDDVGPWQTPPQDVMESILQKKGLIARTHLANVCKSWRSLVMRADIRSAPQLPWLVHPQTTNTNYLTFSSLSEGEVVTLALSNRNGFRGHGRSKFQASSKGWLIIVQEKGLISLDMFLYNPISRAQHQLPSLIISPSFLAFKLRSTLRKWKGFNEHADFVSKVVLSSPNISECIVATVIYPGTELALCRPGDKSWTVFDILNPDGEDVLVDLLFSHGMLYGLVHNPVVGINAARILNFGDDHTMTVELKLVYGYDEFGDTEEYHDGYSIFLNNDCKSYLAESATNSDKEILLIHQLLDCFLDDDLKTEYHRTRGFVVYKIDLDSSSFQEKQNLGDQIIFLAKNSSSLSFPANDFNVQGNCIYFATCGYESTERPYKSHLGQNLSREIGIFSLEDGKIKRPLPSLDVGNPSTCKLCWFDAGL